MTFHLNDACMVAMWWQITQAEFQCNIWYAVNIVYIVSKVLNIGIDAIKTVNALQKYLKTDNGNNIYD